MGRPVVHWEFWTEQPEKVSEFYSKVFDWKVQHMPEMNYRLVETGPGGINGGIMTPQKGPWPSNMSFYIDVEDLDAYNQKIREAGGTIIVERQEVPNVGAFSLFADPDGRVLGLWYQKK
ncbi:MAG TPA: VOC family protein [Acidobacteriota bacterium]|nr:VOC family protein [Acidobacteriota bacterium]